jgi:hypothetical protein
MAAAVTGSKTVTKDVAPTMTAAQLTTLLATAPENMTIAQVRTLHEALKRVSGGDAPELTVGSLLV